MERTDEQKRMSLMGLFKGAEPLKAPEPNQYYLVKQKEAGHHWVLRDCNLKDLRWAARFGTMKEGPKGHFMFQDGKNLQLAIADIPGILATPQAPPRGPRSPVRTTRPVQAVTNTAGKTAKAPEDKDIVAHFTRHHPADDSAQNMFRALIAGFDPSSARHKRIAQQTYGKLGRLATQKILEVTCESPKSFKLGPLGLSAVPAKAALAVNGTAHVNGASNTVANGHTNGVNGHVADMSFEGVLERIDSWNAKLEEAKVKDPTGVARIERILNALTAKLEGSVQ